MRNKEFSISKSTNKNYNYVYWNRIALSVFFFNTHNIGHDYDTESHEPIGLLRANY